MTTQADSDAVWRAIVEATQDALDGIVSACINADGKPKAPDMRDLMKARIMLPARCSNALKK